MKMRILSILAMCWILAGTGCALIEKTSGLTQARELHQTGEAAEATVLEIWDTGITVMDDPVIGFLLEVHRLSKPPYQARTRLLISRIRISSVQPGAVLPVRIDPDDYRRVSLDIYTFSKSKSPDR